jgi:hypothetical protein|tara:strand:+ start:3006 stop:3299 length:294 start_codon:yes stop_codon:yes gene_type:complete
MKYQEFKEKVDQLEENEAINILYSNVGYNLRCYGVSQRFGKSYSLEKVPGILGTMNIEEITEEHISLFTYDMMAQKTTYIIPLSEVEIVEKSKIEYV